jgi:hypothetical protein
LKNFGILCLSHHLILLFLLLRYFEQKFIYTKKKDFAVELSKLKWCNIQELLLTLERIKVGEGIALVPKLQQGCLRIKVVEALHAKELASGRGIEEVKLACNNFIYYIGYEPEDLNDPKAFGYAVSIWERHPLVTKNQLTYDFACGLIRVFKTGFGKRANADYAGLQAYFKTDG